jgi:hypothetical protein
MEAVTSSSRRLGASRILRRSLPWTMAIVALLLGWAIGRMGPQAKLDDTRQAFATAQRDVSAGEDERAGLVTELESIQAERDELEADYSSLKESFDSQIKAITRETERTELQLDRRENSVDARAETISEREADLSAKERDLAERERKVGIIERSTFGDGTWRVGADITPGVYRAAGGSSCYWAILNSSDTWDIGSNGVSVRNPTVTLSAGKWFETNNCGDWHKIG